jgi:hypothetical protein
MPRLLIPVSLALLALSGPASSEPTVELKATPVKVAPPAYEAVAFVTEGPAYGHTDGKLRGRYQRVIFIAPAVAYDRPTIRLETLTYGDEGCCRRIEGAWNLDLEELAAKDVSLPETAASQLTFIRWHTPQTVTVRYGNLVCRLAGIGKLAIKASCEK